MYDKKYWYYIRVSLRTYASRNEVLNYYLITSKHCFGVILPTHVLSKKGAPESKHHDNCKQHSMQFFATYKLLRFE